MNRAERSALEAEIRERLALGVDPVDVCCVLLCSWDSVERVLAAVGGKAKAAAEPRAEIAAPPVAPVAKLLRACMSCGRQFYAAEGEIRCWRCDAPIHREMDAA